VKGFPKCRGKELAERTGSAWWVGGGVGNGERPEEKDGWIQEGKNVGPSNMSVRIRVIGTEAETINRGAWQHQKQSIETPRR
jgi:hypothetical protein